MTPNAHKNPSFLEFGILLEEIRGWSYRSAREFAKKVQLTFSYSTYASFERGESLPNATQLTEIIRALDVTPRALLLKWASCQFLDPHLRLVFEHESPLDQPRKTVPIGKSEAIPAPDLNNIWVLNQHDIDYLRTAPWLWDLIAEITLSYPDGPEVKNLARRFGVTEEELSQTLLKRWLNGTELTIQGAKIFGKFPHVHLPEGSISDEIRNHSLKRITTNLIDTNTASKVASGNAVKKLLRLSITPETAKKWAIRFTELLQQFRQESGGDQTAKAKFDCVVLFGEHQ